MRFSVIPVKTGIQSLQSLGRFWIPACAGMTTFYEIINHSWISGSGVGSKMETRKSEMEG